MKERSDCAAYREPLVEAAYGEISGAAAAGLETHLAICEACRAESESLRSTRGALRVALAAPPRDSAATLVLMPRAPRATARWRSLAAAAAVLALLAVAVSRAEISVGAEGTTVSFHLRGGGPGSSAELEATSAAMLGALRELRARDAQAREEFPRALAEEFDRRSVAIRESQDAALARLVDEIDRRRAQDLGFVLSQMGSLEQRTGVEMARTQQLVQYAVLAQPAGGGAVR